MDHEQPRHHKHHREPDRHPDPNRRTLPFHPGWLYGIGVVLVLLVILVWTVL